MITHYINSNQPCARIGCNELLRPGELVRLHDGELFCSNECIAEWYMQGLNIKEVLLTDDKREQVK